MTKDLLEQYPDICGELRDLELSGRFPKRRAELARQKAAIEAFVEGIGDSRLRRIVMLRALEGLSWQRVAAKMGWKYSIDNLKMKYHRSIK